MATPLITAATLFPPPPSVAFAEDDKLKRAMATARDELTAVRPPSFRLAIIDLATLKWGAHEPDTKDFIASEAKVIALYAAFALRDMVRRFAAAAKLRAAAAVATGFAAATIRGALGVPKPPAPGARPATLFDMLRAEVDPVILSIAHPLLGSTRRYERLPIYEKVFTLPAGGVPDFTGHYKTALREMIVPSSDTAAEDVIQGIGYAYLNGAMKAAQLFKDVAGTDGVGPWLGGDFGTSYTYARIQTQNDQAVAQCGTALSMAKLMAIIVKHGVALDGDAFTQMETLLHDAVSGIDTPFLTRPAPEFSNDALRIPRDKVTHNKLGWEHLKPVNGGQVVGSECTRLQGLFRADKAYALSYQNLDWTKSRSADVAFMIRRAIEIYEH